ncbi:hypothetical protein [Streptomyces sp. WAC06614]|uniref:hypothetical protein n=1 Tax=Streptomyces sp. WAC06614 TaxID=2487416 RepID=UPI000F7AECBE|nr:hypothetical protein [Streptomyces sp. WAC06614]RSS83055.1 hypothetical protein EF918_05020 [Streptomyces sp. WAC06614]
MTTDHRTSRAEACEAAARRGAQWLTARIGADGSYGEDDLACYYKSPAALAAAGFPRQARRVLDFTEGRFATPDADFVTGSGLKSANPVFQEFWCYPNGWLALGAHQLGRYGTARRAYAHLLGYAVDGSGGFAPRRAAPADAITTAHIGQVALTLGDLPTARGAGAWLASLLRAQPAPRSRFLLRADAGGPLADDDSPLHVLTTGAPGQPYFMIGYPIAFLTRLAETTGDDDVLAAAVGYADYALSCGENLRTTLFSHKVAWGAAVLARRTGDPRHADLAAGTTDHLLAAQAPDGCWSPDGPAHTTYDDTAELTHWLVRIATELPD